jgi:hypothetical protein
MTQNNPTTLIAFLARGREIGFVVLYEGTVLRYGIKTIKGRKQAGAGLTRRVEQILDTLLRTAGRNAVVVVEQDAALSKKGALCQTLNSLAERWKEQGRRVCALSWEEVKRRLSRSEWMTQDEIARVVVERQPLLWSLDTPRQAQRMRYWKKVLLAAALAEVTYRRLEQER